MNGETPLFDRAGRRKYLNERERRALLAALLREPDTSRKAFCLTLFYTGCRISEALNLTVDRVDLTELTLVFETLKRRKRGCFRSVPIPDDLTRLLARVVSQGSIERVWTFSRSTGYRTIKKKMSEAGIIGSMASPKGLRHGFGIACVAEKIPLTTVQKWLGHSRMQNTAIYLEFSGREERNLARRVWKATATGPKRQISLPKNTPNRRLNA